MEALSAKLIGVAISEEKKLYRVFQQIDTDRSGKLDRDELVQAVKYVRVEVAVEVRIGSMIEAHPTIHYPPPTTAARPPTTGI